MFKGMMIENMLFGIKNYNFKKNIQKWNVDCGGSFNIYGQIK